MNKRGLYRAVLVLGTVCLLIVGACGLWLRSERRQEALNRQLIAAMEAGNGQEALALTNEGADPNTRHRPSPRLTLWQRVNSMFGRAPRPTNNSPTAFMTACRGYFLRNDAGFNNIVAPSNPVLVQAMLNHGANLRAQDGNGETPLIFSVAHPEIVRILLDHGAAVNVKPEHGIPALEAACIVHSPGSVKLLLECGADVNINDDSGVSLLFRVLQYPAPKGTSAEILSLLLAHEANPNARNESESTEDTPLGLASDQHRTDLVAILKQAGAKK